LGYFAGHCTARAAITQPKFAELVSLACPDVEWLAITGTDGGEAAPAPPKYDRFEAIDADPAILGPRAHDPAAPFGVQYTSGTTARPKAVLWTHANALWGACVSAAHEGLRADDIHLITMPLFYTNAQAYSVLASLWAGATMVLQPRFSASRFWPAAVAHRCSWTSIVPFCTKALANLPVPERHFFRKWGNAYSAPPEDALFGVTTMGWWGMTETITHGLVDLADHANPSLSMGRAAPEYEIRLLNDAGQPAAPGETGDLAIRGIRGLSIFAEYLYNREATAAAFDTKGFLLTGEPFNYPQLPEPAAFARRESCVIPCPAPIRERCDGRGSCCLA
jgi:carnitine-CoA ligase